MLPISIVIPTYERGDLLARMLPTYVQQQCKEIVIVDDCSTISVAEIVGRLSISSTQTHLKILTNTHRMQQPTSRMIGVRAASQPLVFFGEDDAYLAKGHIRKLYDMYCKGVSDVVAGPWLTTNSLHDSRLPKQLNLTAGDTVDLQRLVTRRDFCPTRPIMVPTLHTLALMPNETVLAYPFDSNYRGNAFREETDYYLTLSASGIKLAYVAAPPAYHYKGPLNRSGGQHRNLLAELTWYEYWVARNNTYLLRKHQSYLNSLGRKTSPRADTILYMLQRLRGYPGRIRHSINNAVRKHDLPTGSN